MDELDVAAGVGLAPALRIEPVRYTDPDVVAMVAEVQAEYTVRYGGPDKTPLDPAMFDPPSGAFFVGYLPGTGGDRRAVAMGGWRFREDVAGLGRSRAAEIKRMYVAATSRRAGLARRVLGHLEDTARSAGADLMVLETGLEQPEAIALYESSGYRPVEGFGYYQWSPLVRYFGKPL